MLKRRLKFAFLSILRGAAARFGRHCPIGYQSFDFEKPAAIGRALVRFLSLAETISSELIAEGARAGIGRADYVSSHDSVTLAPPLGMVLRRVPLRNQYFSLLT
jgi:hypothetical protein